MSRAEGGQIYEGNQFRTSITQSGRGQVDVSNLANSGVQEQLDRNKEQALVLYQQGLKLSAAQGMEQIYNEYQNDPETLKAELEKLNEKMTSEIPDTNTKIAFRTNFIIQSGSLINQAQANYDKIQYQKKKSSYFDTIQANNKSIARALNNAFNGTGTPDDLVNYQTAIQQNIGLINARNDDGTYIFSDSQRMSMSNAVDKLAAQSFSAALNDMDDDKRSQVMAALDNDSMILLQGEDNGEVKQLNLKDAFTPEVYSDMKKSAKILDNKIKKKQLAEYNLNKRYSQMMLNIDPSEQNYKIWEFYHRDATPDKKAQMRKMAGFVPNEDTVTNFEGVNDYINAIKELSTYNVENDDDAFNFINKASDYIYAAQLANHRKDEKTNEPLISGEELNKQTNSLLELMRDKTIRGLVNKMPSGNWFEKTKASINTGYYRPDKREQEAMNKVSQIGMDTMIEMSNLAFMPFEDNETVQDREKKMWKVYRKGREDAIRAKYWYIPSIQEGLIEGKIYEINGMLYKYNDILSNNSWELVE